MTRDLDMAEHAARVNLDRARRGDEKAARELVKVIRTHIEAGDLSETEQAHLLAALRHIENGGDANTAFRLKLRDSKQAKWVEHEGRDIRLTALIRHYRKTGEANSQNAAADMAILEVERQDRVELGIDTRTALRAFRAWKDKLPA